MATTPFNNPTVSAIVDAAVPPGPPVTDTPRIPRTPPRIISRIGMGGSPPSANLTESAENEDAEIGEVLAKRGCRIGKSIGEGSYCKVKVAEQTLAKGGIRRLACKVIDKRLASTEFVTKFLPRELRVVRSLRHPHIVSLLDVIEAGPKVLILMELCDRGDLLEWIRSRGAIPEHRAKLFFRGHVGADSVGCSQLVSAVEYLHRLDVAHRDLKCENVLLTTRPIAGVRLADFGFSRLCRDRQGRRTLSNTFCGSAAYAAPEILEGSPYNPKLYDMWSLGCVLFIMLTASMPFDDSNVPKMLRAQLNRSVHFPKGACAISGPARQLIMHLLEPDVTKRANIRQVGRAQWLCYRNVSSAPASGDGRTVDGTRPLDQSRFEHQKRQPKF